MTYRQAQHLGAQVRKGETGAPVVYHGATTKTRRDAVTGEEAAQDVRFLKIYTVFNVAQIDGLPERFQPAPAPVEAPALPTPERITHADAFFAEPGPSYATAEGRPITRPRRTEFRCRPSMRSATPRAICDPRARNCPLDSPSVAARSQLWPQEVG